MHTQMLTKHTVAFNWWGHFRTVYIIHAVSESKRNGVINGKFIAARARAVVHLHPLKTFPDDIVVYIYVCMYVCVCVYAYMRIYYMELYTLYTTQSLHRHARSRWIIQRSLARCVRMIYSLLVLLPVTTI